MTESWLVVLQAMAARSLRIARVRGACNHPSVEFNAAMRLQELLRSCRHNACAGTGPDDQLLLLQHSPVRRSAAGKLLHTQM